MYHYSHFRDDTNLREVKYRAQYPMGRWKGLDLNTDHLGLEVSKL